MKKITRVLSIVLCVVMVFSMVAVAAACGKKKTAEVTVRYFDKSVEVDAYAVTSGKAIPADKVAADPVPAADKVFSFWSEDGTTDFIANGKPTKDTTLFSVYRDRTPGEIVVTFNTNGGKPNVKSQVLKAGDKVSRPGTITLSGATFNMWRAQDESDAFDFDNRQVTGDLVIEANWEEGTGKALVLSSGNFDKVFSPFFATSAYDTEVSGATQVSMLSANANGEVFVGESAPTVVKSYTETIWVGDTIDKTGAIASALPAKAKEDASQCKTVYEFVIKNGIKFSDGTDLTIKDVLFNLYVYLDPAYTGSSTVYSTNIVGLTAYRTQDPDAQDGSTTGSSHASQVATARITRLRDYFSANTPSKLESNRNRIAAEGEDYHRQVFEDLQRLRINFYKELQSDWNNYSAIENIEEDYAEYGFKDVWEVFLFNCGLITAEYHSTGEVKWENGAPKIGYGNLKDFNHTPEYLIPYVFNSMLGILTSAEVGTDYLKNSPAPKVDLIFDASTGTINEGATLAAIGSLDDIGTKNKSNLIARSTDSVTGDVFVTNVSSISRGRAAGQTLTSYIQADELAKYLRSQSPDGESLAVPNIKGITAYNNGENDVLKIEVVGIDPKAIWNFGFTVAPMHYYSDPSTKTGFDAKDGYSNFVYPGVAGVAADSNNYHLGFKQCDLDYLQGVINHSSVQGLPMGAGTFKASSKSGKSSTSPADFCNDNTVYLMRNNNFKTTGEGMSNARFEFLRYKVVDTSKMLNSLVSGDVHFGDPAATDNNISTLNDNSNKLNYKLVENNGFGYVGVNAKFVPDVNIRRAIMTALDTSIIISSYYGDRAKIITRPISTVSWASPKNAPDAYPYVNANTAIDTVKDFVGEAGYSSAQQTGGVYWKYNENLGTKTFLEYEFVVAGTSTDHPAYAMFQNAAEILNQCGFKITVKNDAFALSKLASGGLTVWAAAWSAGIDPDMYQVYHYRSTASSIKNWGFAEILQYGSKEEKDDLEALANRIELGRQTTIKESRIQIYGEALDFVMDLAVEYPTYQRDNLYAYNNNVIDASTINTNTSPYTGLLAYIWKVRLK